MAKKWVKFPHADKAYVHDAAGLKKHWARLHRGDCEPLPKAADALAAWGAFHAGDFGKAVEAGLAAGGSGINAAVKAQVVYGHYLEKSAAAKSKLFEEAAAWAEEHRSAAPKDVNAHYLHAFALGRYSQCISVGKALAQGLRREDQGRAAHRDEARAQARGREHRLRRLPGRGDRQGRRLWSPG